jgi:hypothetical protein
MVGKPWFALRPTATRSPATCKSDSCPGAGLLSFAERFRYNAGMEFNSTIGEAGRRAAELAETARRGRDFSQQAFAAESAIARLGSTTAIFNAMQPVIEMQDSVRDTMARLAAIPTDLNSTIWAIAKSHLDVIEQTRRIQLDLVRSYSDAIESAQRFQRETIAAHFAMVDAIPKQVMHAMAAEFTAIQHTRQRMIEGLTHSLPRMIDLAHLVPRSLELSDLAKLIPSFDSLTLPASALAELEQELSEFEQLADEPNVRESIFAFCDSAEFLPEREYVTQELAKRQGFDQLSIAEQLAELRQVVQANSSPRLVLYAVAIAVNWLSDYLTIQNKSLMIAIVFVVFALDWFTSKQRISTARKLGRESRLSCTTRLVAHSCDAFDSPRRRKQKIATLESGLLVENVEKQGGWQLVEFTDLNSKHIRMGWIRSKYLRRL